METAMDWASVFTWMKGNFHFVLLGGFLLIQWILLQGFMVHYFLNRPRTPTLQRERAQIEMLEKLVGFQANQIERLYAKLAELHREVQSLSATREASRAASLPENSMVSLGEVSLKKRLTELSQSRLPESGSSTKVH